jgi:hypothetical protein
LMDPLTLPPDDQDPCVRAARARYAAYGRR